MKFFVSMCFSAALYSEGIMECEGEVPGLAGFWQGFFLSFLFVEVWGCLDSGARKISSCLRQSTSEELVRLIFRRDWRVGAGMMPSC